MGSFLSQNSLWRLILSIVDLIKMACFNLWQRKFRTAFNLVGIVIGNVVLLVALAGTSGVRVALNAIIDASEIARYVLVHAKLQKEFRVRPSKALLDSQVVISADMSDSRRKRIALALRNQLAQESRQEESKNSLAIPVPAVQLDRTGLELLSNLPHVQAVVPLPFIGCIVSYQGVELPAQINSAVAQSALFRKRIIAGDMLSEKDLDGVLIDEFLAYRFGFESDAQLQEVVGKKLSIIFKEGPLSMRQRMHPSSPEDLRVIDEHTFSSMKYVHGVLRIGHDEDSLKLMGLSVPHLGGSGIFVLPSVLRDTIEQSSPKSPSVTSALLLVDKGSSLREVGDAIQQSGFTPWSAQNVVESIDHQLGEWLWILYTIAGFVFSIAFIGISNTLMISVIERTQEFGILKSIGATDSQLVWLMLLEGAILGLLGALVAVVVSESVAAFGNQWFLKTLETRYRIGLNGQMIQFSTGAIIFVVVCSSIVCMLASVFPAWRAARLDPIVALRRT